MPVCCGTNDRSAVLPACGTGEGTGHGAERRRAHVACRRRDESGSRPFADGVADGHVGVGAFPGGGQGPPCMEFRPKRVGLGSPRFVTSCSRQLARVVAGRGLDLRWRERRRRQIRVGQLPQRDHHAAARGLRRRPQPSQGGSRPSRGRTTVRRGRAGCRLAEPPAIECVWFAGPGEPMRSSASRRRNTDEPVRFAAGFLLAVWPRGRFEVAPGQAMPSMASMRCINSSCSRESRSASSALAAPSRFSVSSCCASWSS